MSAHDTWSTSCTQFFAGVDDDDDDDEEKDEEDMCLDNKWSSSTAKAPLARASVWERLVHTSYKHYELLSMHIP